MCASSHSAMPKLPSGFTLAFNEATATIETSMWGFWSAELLRRYLGELRDTTDQARTRRADFAILIDNRRFVVQSAVVSDGLITSIRKAREAHGAPIALVVSGALSKLQAQRIASHGNVTVHDDFVSARAWISLERTSPRAHEPALRARRQSGSTG